MISARVTRVQRRVLAAALLAAAFGVSATAQESVPETPPELKDFRLDTPPPREKAPEPAPTVTPPPVVPTLETPKPATATPPRPLPKSSPQPAAKTAPVTGVPETSAPEAAPEPLPSVTAEPLPELDTQPEPAAPEATTAPAIDWTAEAMRFWPLLAGLLAALLGLLAFRLLRRRRRDSLEGFEDYAEPGAELPVEDAEPLPLTITPAIPRPILNASFEPSDARLSLANLTVTGCLRLRYDGPDPLKSLHLRNQVISACEGQRAMIDAFHNDPNAGQIDTLGSAQPGEEIVLTLELQVPCEALQAFDWRERRFIAPILLLNLGSGDGSVEPCRINCLVGQEGDPLSPRMKPLPIDRGPKYFETLRFRPIAA
jgi:hypothetical protein